MNTELDIQLRQAHTFKEKIICVLLMGKPVTVKDIKNYIHKRIGKSPSEGTITYHLTNLKSTTFWDYVQEGKVTGTGAFSFAYLGDAKNLGDAIEEASEESDLIQGTNILEKELPKTTCTIPNKPEQQVIGSEYVIRTEPITAETIDTTELTISELIAYCIKEGRAISIIIGGKNG